MVFYGDCAILFYCTQKRENKEDKEMRHFPQARRTGHMSGEVKEQHLQGVKNRITDQLAISKKAMLLLNVNSEFGGSVPGAIGFYDWVRSNKIPLVTVAEGEVASSALYIFLAAQSACRFITENCQIFLHRHEWSGGGASLTIAELRAEVESMEFQENRGIRIICDNTGLTRNKVLRIMNRPTYLSPEKAVQLGFASDLRRNIPSAMMGKVVEYRPRVVAAQARRRS